MRPTAPPAWSPRARSVHSVAWSAAAPGRGAYRRAWSLAVATSAATSPTAPAWTSWTVTALAALSTAARLLAFPFTFAATLSGERRLATFARSGADGLARTTVAAIPTITTRLRTVAGALGGAFGLGLQCLHRKAQAAALVAIDQLHLHA